MFGIITDFSHNLALKSLDGRAQSRHQRQHCPGLGCEFLKKQDYIGVKEASSIVDLTSDDQERTWD